MISGLGRPGRGQDLDPFANHRGFASMQREQVRHAIFPHHHECARFDDDRTTGTADFRVGVAIIRPALRRPTHVTDGSSKSDTDLAERQHLGRASVAHGADHAVGLCDTPKLTQ